MGIFSQLGVFGIGLNIGKYHFGCMVQQIRTTFVLKRRNPLMLSKLDSKWPKKLKTRNFIYDLVEFTECRKEQNINLLLTSDFEGLGESGDLVSVKPHFGRQNLILPKLAVYASPENLEKYADLIEARKTSTKTKFSSLYVYLVLRLLSKRTFLVIMNPNETWTIEPWHIRIACRNEKIVVPDYAIELPEQPISGPDIAKNGKEFAVFIKINKTERIPVRCKLHHYGSDLDPDWPYNIEEPLLLEQAKLLSEMPRLEKKIIPIVNTKKRGKSKSYINL